MFTIDHEDAEKAALKKDKRVDERRRRRNKKAVHKSIVQKTHDKTER